MFSDNLSGSLLKFCETHQLSYERVAERCGCSSRYFGSIVRKTSCPSLLVFEGICRGLEQTPNQLLGVKDDSQQAAGLSYRVPMPVNKIIILDSGRETTSFPVCPQCGVSLEREFQPYCDRCGQCLSWRELDHSLIIRRP